MTRQERIPPLLIWILRVVLPKDRRLDVISDLEGGYIARVSRLGDRAAYLHLYREFLCIILWRLGRRSEVAIGLNRGRRAPTGIRAAGWDLASDIRHSFRALLRRPRNSLLVICILSLGIGAPTTVFTLVNTMFFQPPEHIDQPHRLLRLHRVSSLMNGGRLFGNLDYQYFQENASTLSGLAAYGGDKNVAYSLDGHRADQLLVCFTSGNFFQVLGVAPFLGRSFLPEENVQPGSSPVAILSYGFWERAMGADSEAVGSTLAINGHRFTVVGVAPKGFTGISPVEPDADVWVPIAMYGQITRATHTIWWRPYPTPRSRWFEVVGRLAPGVTFEAATAELTALSDAHAYRGREENERLVVSRQFLYLPEQEATLTTLSAILLAAASIVVAISCANVALILLSRTALRRCEIGIRTALGATRGRIVRQLLTENLLLGLGGGAMGIWLSFLVADVAGSLLPFSFSVEFMPDVRVLVTATSLSLLTALAAGLVPAMMATRSDFRSMIEARHSRGRGNSTSTVLVAFQVGLSVVLVAGAVLFGRSFVAASVQDMGFAKENRLVVPIDLAMSGYWGTEHTAFVEHALERLATLPGATAVTTTTHIPFDAHGTKILHVPSVEAGRGNDRQLRVGMHWVGPQYFDVAGVPVVRGRAFRPDDLAGAAPAVVVNDEFARTVWPEQDPIGKTLLIDDENRTVVGVALTATYHELGERPYPQVYASVYQVGPASVYFVIMTERNVLQMTTPVLRTLREIDRDLAIEPVATMESVFSDQVARYRVSALLVGSGSLIALLMAATGLYGVVSVLVGQRTKEIGVRIALGATRIRVATEILRHGLRVTGAGLAIGLVGAISFRKYTQSLLFGVAHDDPWPLMATCVVLFVVSLSATLVPTLGAARVDPAEAIREE